MAVDIFARFEAATGSPIKSIEGETMDTVMKSYIELKSISYGVENAVTIGSATGGAGGGKAVFQEVVIEKLLDSASPLLFQALTTGAHYGTVTIAFRKSGGTTAKAGQPYLIVILKTVFVKEINVAAASGDDAPAETIKLAVGAISIDYSKQMTDGSMTRMPLVSWNQLTNTTKMPV